MVSRFVLKATVLLALLGFAISRPEVLKYFAAQNDVMNLFLWYVIFYAFLVASSLVLYGRFDLVTLRVGFGILLITFALGVWLYLPASDYAILVVGGNPATVPTFLTASEDEVVYKGLAWALGTGNLWLLGFLTYVAVPSFIFFAGALVIGPKRLSESFGRLLGAP